MDIYVRESEAPGEEDPYRDLMPEVLPGPEVVPEHGPVLLQEHEPEVVRAPTTLHRLLDRAKPSLAEAGSLAALVLEALAVMHDNTGGHGSLDSQSIRLTPAGTVRIAGRRSSDDAARTDRARRRMSPTVQPRKRRSLLR